MTIPGWWTTTLLALGAYRTWKLLAEDTILDGPRRYVTGTARELMACPWCLGFWLSIAWWAAWQAWPHVTLGVSVPFAISAIVGIIAWITS